MKSCNIDNDVVIFAGGCDYTDLNDILKYNKKNLTWEKVGEMKVRRFQHAVAVLADVSHLCP